MDLHAGRRGLVPLVGLMAAYTLGYALLMYVVRLWSTFLWWAVAVGGWALFEFARSRFPLGGFPWGAAGFPIGTIPGPRGAAQWIGPTGWGVLVIGFAASLVLLAEEEPDPSPWRPWWPSSSSCPPWAWSSLRGGGPGGAGRHRPGQLPCPRGALRRREAVDLRLAPRPDPHHRPGQRGPGGARPEDSFGGSANPTFNPEVAAQMGAGAVRIGAYLLAGGSRSAGPTSGTTTTSSSGPMGPSWASISSATRCRSGSSCCCATCSSSFPNWTRCPATSPRRRPGGVLPDGGG